MLRFLASLMRRPAASASAPTPAPPPRDDANALLAKAIEMLQAGRRAEAITALKALVESHSDLAAAQLMLGGLLHEDEDFEEARDCYLLASAHRADWWAPRFQLGRLAFERGHMADAVDALTKAIALGAPGAEVQNILGAAHQRAGDSKAAAACFRAALALDPKLVPAHSNLGYALFKELEEYDEGERHIKRAIELAPDDPAALCNLVMVLQQRGRYDEALALTKRLLAEDPSRAEVRLNRALMLLSRRDFTAWPDYEARRQMPESRKSGDLPWPDWDGSSLAGKTIYVYREQGIGDEIMFSSCLPEVIAQAQSCIVECSPKLEAIFRRSFPTVTVLLRDEWRKSAELSLHAPDFKVAIGSLPLFLRKSAADFPDHAGYLNADATRVGEWKAKLGRLPGRRKVGISWRGGIATTQRSLRSVPLEAWRPVLSIPDVDFVSLQYGVVEPELEAFRKAHGIRITHWPEAIDDYDETAALVCALDFVVSVQTAVVHLAGALGKSALALIPAIPEWRYGVKGDSMIWYPSVRLLRQSHPGLWAPVMEAARTQADARMARVSHMT